MLSCCRRCRNIVCCDDKAAHFQALARDLGRKGGWTVYCGDSLSDLGALLAADVGIILGCSSSLRKVAAAGNVSIVPLTEGAQCFMVMGSVFMEWPLAQS